MNNRLKGTISIISAVACYGLYGTFAKMMGTSFGNFTQNWVRNLLVLIFILFYSKIARLHWKGIRGRDIKWMLAWTLSGSLNTILLYISFNNIPIGTAYFLLYASMIGTGFISGKLLYGEKINNRKSLALGLSILGLIIIYFLDIKASQFIYTASALIAGVMVGLWNTLSKKVSDKYPNQQLVFIDATISCLVGLVGGLVFLEKLPIVAFSTPWLAVILWAIAQLAATGLAIYGFKHLEAQTASVILPLEVLFGTLFGFLLFGQTLPVTTLVGGLMIASAAAIAGTSEGD